MALDQTDEEMLTACALKAVRMYAESHPRPSVVNAVQAAEMLGISAQTVRKMVRDGRIRLNRLGMIAVTEIDSALKI